MRQEILNKMKQTANYIFCHPEVAEQEKESSRALAEFLSGEGFDVHWGTGGFDTAFLAEWGEGKPVIGFLAEYDALPGLGQNVCSEYSPTGGPGHGCGVIIFSEPPAREPRVR